MNVSLFTPIVQSNSKENLASLRFTTRFFNFGQTCYRVTPLSKDQFLYLELADHQKPTWLGVALRIVAILTIIIPLFMMMGAIIYRAANKFVVKQLELTNHFSSLSPDVQKLICEYAFLDSISLKFVNKHLNSFFNFSLMGNGLVSEAFEQSLKSIEIMNKYQMIDSCSKLADFFLQNGYKKQALDLLNEKYERVGDPVKSSWIIKSMALCDLERALEIAHSQDIYVRNCLLYYISTAMIPIDLKKAIQINKTITNFENDCFLRDLAIKTAQFDLDKGLEISATIYGINKYFAFITIIENLEKNHPEKTKQLFESEGINWIALETPQLVVRVIDYYARNHLMNEAILLATQAQDAQGYAVIAKESVKVNPEAALAWINTLAKKYQFYALAEIVKATDDSDKAKELIEHMFMLNEYEIEVLGKRKEIVCAELMASFDINRAIVMANSISLSEASKAEALTCIIKKIITQNAPLAWDLAKTVLSIGKKLPFSEEIYDSYGSFSTINEDRFMTFFSLVEALRTSIVK